MGFSATGYNENLSVFRGETLKILITGIITSLLLFALSLALINANLRAAQIQRLNLQLEKLNNDKDRFISILGHDLRSPFSALLGLSEILKEDIHRLEMAEIEDIVNSINKSALSTFNLLDDLLMWAKTQKGNIPFKPHKLNLSEICTSILEILSSGSNSKNIKIEYSSLENKFAYADIVMLKTILRNLVSNAIKFSNKGGTIIIYAVETPENVTITVSDNGIGIKPGDLTKLFDISQVLTTSGTEGETGTGLGLFLCKEFVEKHGGTIFAESEYGKGSKFKFTLPNPNLISM